MGGCASPFAGSKGERSSIVFLGERGGDDPNGQSWATSGAVQNRVENGGSFGAAIAAHRASVREDAGERVEMFSKMREKISLRNYAIQCLARILGRKSPGR